MDRMRFGAALLITLSLGASLSSLSCTATQQQPAAATVDPVVPFIGWLRSANSPAPGRIIARRPRRH